MRRIGSLAAVGTLLVLAGAARCEVGIEEARKIAEQHAGHSLGDAKPEVRDWDVLRVARFEDPARSGPARKYEVDLIHGYFVGWAQDADGAPPNASLAVNDEQAMRIAQETARAHFGSSADALKWEVVCDLGPWVRLWATGPLAGDPLRLGLTPSAMAEVSRRNGAVLLFHMDMPSTTVPVEVKITAERAIEIAREQPGLGGAKPVGAPELSQRGDRAKWCVQFERQGKPYRSCEVDAVTGATLVGHVRGGRPDAPSGSAQPPAPSASPEPSGATGPEAPPPAPSVAPPPDPAPPVRSWLTPVTGGAIGAAIVVLAAALVLIRRRRV